jgi:hypothetical protein
VNKVRRSKRTTLIASFALGGQIALITEPLVVTFHTVTRISAGKSSRQSAWRLFLGGIGHSA